jgi:hypothetical protein
MAGQVGGDEGHGRHASTEGSRADSEDSFPALRHEEPFGADIVTPNAPSSPQWSLADRGGEPVSAAPEPAETSAPEPAVTATEEPAAAERQKALPEADAPREPRKGWWQRRFGI